MARGGLLSCWAAIEMREKFYLPGAALLVNAVTDGNEALVQSARRELTRSLGLTTTQSRDIAGVAVMKFC